MIPVIMQGDLTGRWYIVTRYTKKDGCIVAQTKYDCTDRINEIIALHSPLTLELVGEVAQAIVSEIYDNPAWSVKECDCIEHAYRLLMYRLRQQMGGATG